MLGKKEKNTLYVTHSGELLVWLIVILIFVAIYTLTYVKQERTNNDYTIFMSDVDGLIVGSPVRMMGIEVGHVTKIKPTNEEVFVKFLIKDESIKIPQGTVATVEFSGMAGSKSLELYLPDEKTYRDNSTPILTPSSPKRLHDALGLLNDMYDKLSSIINSTSYFGSKLKEIELPTTGTDEDAKQFIDYSNKVLDDSMDKEIQFRKKIGGKK